MNLSLNNPKIKLIAKLKEKKFRDKEGLFIAEGLHLIEEAVKRGAAVDFIVYAEDFKGAGSFEGYVNVFRLSKADFKKVADTETPQGIIAVVRRPQHAISSLFEGSAPFFVICDGIQDPGNLGTIIRTAAAAGCSGVAVSKDSVDPYNPKVVRSTGGSIFTIPVVAEVDVKEVIRAAKEKKVKVIAADASAKTDVFSADLKSPSAIVIGNEGAGSSNEVLALCDEKVSIPMKKGVESLNAAVSAAVILYEAVRQRS